MNIFKIVVGVSFIALSNLANGQVAEFDKLEMLFEQRHYKKVHRLSNRLLDKPEFDYSMVPTYYKSLSLFQLAQNDHWLKKHPDALKFAPAMLLNVRKSARGEKLFQSHMYELSWLKKELQTWYSRLKETGQSDNAQKVLKILADVFNSVPDNVEKPVPVSQEQIVETAPELETSNEEIGTTNNSSGKRNSIVAEAKKHVGTPYMWAGATPAGFDCSGFTSYVMGLQGVELSRRSSDQFDTSKKLKKKNVQKGDLIFFNNGSGISHVGIIISEKGEPLVMIHSSSSKGIIITEVEQSEYWMKRLHGFGTYVN